MKLGHYPKLTGKSACFRTTDGGTADYNTLVKDFKSFEYLIKFMQKINRRSPGRGKNKKGGNHKFDL